MISRVINRLRTQRSVDAIEIAPVGWAEHQEGVDKLLRSFYAVPKDKRVRLAKKTSNLFRGRSGEQVGLDVSGLGEVIEIDPIAKTAEVQGMCTYEDLVDATLPHGLMPFVVPQLKTITLGGAVTGMGVESTSFRDGLPHESVLEMDILTGTGEIITCSREKNVDLFRLFPNSYGSLGYAVRLRIELRAVKPYVELREVRFDDVEELSTVLARVSETQTYDGVEVHGLDGVVFSPEEAYLVMARFTDDEGPTSDYTREKIFYRSLQHPRGIRHDRLTVRDYIWRWDTDWFWCSRAFGAQNPRVRRIWPRQLRRSSFYWKLVRLDRTYELEYHFIKKPKGLPRGERVVQDIEVTPDKLPEFLRWFFTASDIQPVWLCPIRLREGVEELIGRGDIAADSPAPWPLYPLRPSQTWINVGFWSGVEGNHVDPSAPGNGAFNRVIESKINELGGHKSLYSEAFYSPEKFAELYGGDLPERIKAVTDPSDRFPSLFEKTVNDA